MSDEKRGLGLAATAPGTAAGNPGPHIHLQEALLRRIIGKAG
jgi:hypothetical protein